MINIKNETSSTLFVLNDLITWGNIIVTPTTAAVYPTIFTNERFIIVLNVNSIKFYPRLTYKKYNIKEITAVIFIYSYFLSINGIRFIKTIIPPIITFEVIILTIF